MNVLLDTNVLGRLAQHVHPQHAIAKAATAAVKDSGSTPCVVPQNLYELWVICTRPLDQNGLGMPTADASRQLSSARTLFRLFPDKPEVYAEWERLVATHDVKGKPAHDARLVAAMNAHGIDTLLTFNKRDFVRYGQIKVLSPDELIAPS